MPTKFDTAIQDLVEECERTPDFVHVHRACVIRDLRGRVRLVVDATPAMNLETLTAGLQARLGAWFVGPVIGTAAGSMAERRLADTLLDRASGWPVGWPTTRNDVTGAPVPIGARWMGYRRVLSKQAWLDNHAEGGAWPLDGANPAIIAFYSFKGGVGRSTLLGVIAWQLAKLGKKVVCLDLDLEAPGLAGLLDVNPAESVIDHLLTHAATGKTPPNDPVSTIQVHGETLHVVPAGQMDRGYIEKLARLDYLGTTTAAASPVAKALKVLLERIKGQHRPQFILIDCRAGIHDLGGLSLTDVAHVDVLVGRDTPQGREGLSLTLEVLNARRKPESQRIALVQTMVPLPLEGDAARITTSRFRSAMYEACSRTVYQSLDDEPSEEDDTAAHYPWAVAQYDELAACQRLSDVSPFHFAGCPVPTDSRTYRGACSFGGADMSRANSVLDDVRRRSLLADLQGLGSDADAHDRLVHVFLPLPSHAAALKPSKLIVRGERGTGKTALFHLLRELDETGLSLDTMFPGVVHEDSRWIEGFSERGKAHPSTDVLDQFGASSGDDALLRAFWFGHLVGVLASSAPAEEQPPEPFMERWRAYPH